jgi:hypothetical protein
MRFLHLFHAFFSLLLGSIFKMKMAPGALDSNPQTEEYRAEMERMSSIISFSLKG